MTHFPAYRAYRARVRSMMMQRIAGVVAMVLLLTGVGVMNHQALVKAEAQQATLYEQLTALTQDMRDSNTEFQLEKALHTQLARAGYERAHREAEAIIREADALVKSSESHLLPSDAGRRDDLIMHNEALRRLHSASVNLWSDDELDAVARDIRGLMPAAEGALQPVKEGVAAWEAEQARLREEARRAAEARAAAEAAAAEAAAERERSRYTDRGGQRQQRQETSAPPQPAAPAPAPAQPSGKVAAEAEVARLGIPMQWGNTLGHMGAYWPGSGVISIGTQVQTMSAGVARSVVRHEAAHLIIEGRCGVYYPDTGTFERVAEAYADIYLGGLSWMHYGYNGTHAAYAANVASGTC